MISWEHALKINWSWFILKTSKSAIYCCFQTLQTELYSFPCSVLCTQWKHKECYPKGLYININSLKTYLCFSINCWKVELFNHERKTQLGIAQLSSKPRTLQNKSSGAVYSKVHLSKTHCQQIARFTNYTTFNTMKSVNCAGAEQGEHCCR